MPSQENGDAAPARDWDDSEQPFCDFFRDRKVLITGGLGFLGSNLAIRLLRYGAGITLLDSLVPHGGGFHNIAPIRDRVAVNIADMRDAHSLDILMQDKDVVFNLAGQVSHGDSMRDPKLDLDCNCVSALNLVKACRQHAPDVRMLYSSTRQVYGRPLRLPVTEDHPALPIDINGIHKLAAEYYHLLYDSVYGVHSTVLRLTNTYSPRQRIGDERHGVAAVFLHHALCGRTIELYGGGEQRRDFNYVDDVVDAMLSAVMCPRCQGKVFNLGATKAHSLLQFAAAMREHCTFEVRCVPFPPGKKCIDIGGLLRRFFRLSQCHGLGTDDQLGRRNTADDRFLPGESRRVLVMQWSGRRGGHERGSMIARAQACRDSTISGSTKRFGRKSSMPSIKCFSAAV
jgi:nucleoside-diphosphate-sugar epimerase